jgi:uncharacterized protein with ParB-like and HNH nuclease domain
MENRRDTIRKTIRLISGEESVESLFLPNIQRNFIWKKEQIEKLFDSIMREYPISTFLFWKTRELIKVRKFIDNYRDSLRFTDFYVPKDEETKLVVLDGQQRLQSLYIALKGSYNENELYFNVFSGNGEFNDPKYRFEFFPQEKAIISQGWIKFKDLVYSSKDYYTLAEEVISKINSGDPKLNPLIRKNVSIVKKEFCERENIISQQLDSVDNPEVYELNDVVEIFIRANSGGTPLSKSDLMFSLLSANWEDVEDELNILLDDLNKTGYKFDRDFILKCCLVLIETGAKYDVLKFRDENNLKTIKDNWVRVTETIKDIADFLYSKTYLRDDKALSSYNVLIPLIYFRYNYKNEWKRLDKNNINSWLIKMLLSGAFSGSSDTLLDVVIRNIKNNKDFEINTINSVILNNGRNISITEGIIFNTRYGMRDIYALMNILYKNFQFQPLYSGNLPTIDHIFPKSKLKKIKIKSTETNRMVMRYKSDEINQFANLMLLSKEENVEEKRDIDAYEWLSRQNSTYLKLHSIPGNKDLWKIENFEYFIQERKNILKNKFKSINLI